MICSDNIAIKKYCPFGAEFFVSKNGLCYGPDCMAWMVLGDNLGACNRVYEVPIGRIVESVIPQKETT